MYIRLVMKYSKLCNLKCGYCYEMPSLSDPARMSPGEIRRVYVRFRDYLLAYGDTVTPQTLTFFWQGGEPFLQPPSYWEAVFSAQREVFSGHCPNLAITNHVQTNLTLLQEKHLPVLSRHRVRLGFSYDVINDLRVSRAGRRTAARVEKKVDWLCSRKVPLMGSAVITRLNIGRPGAIADYFLRRNLPFVVLCVDEGKGVLPGPTEAAADFRGYGRFFCALHALPQVRDALRRGIGVEPLTTAIAKLRDYAGGSPCPVSEEASYENEWVLVIDTNGDVYPHGDSYQPEFCYGNILSQPLEALLDSDNRKKRVERSRRRIQVVCADCFLYLKGCSGIYVSHAQPAKYREYEENMSCFVGYVAAMMSGDPRLRTPDGEWTCRLPQSRR